ncbi:MAG: hypothetical protein A2504_09690 [Bdellovibrionales bacterium RIFOXYD12_FULL_39_22]|nr:MAG: hypothetical protein A2385_13180 [Bdellovibrionales bacterium RIFOXYB1_FULL_39_21]OFZ40999.1 MAG: hypothetical protein A2485_16690 [Bdellovibrionales bacterium RIFOXYC12_FULL_39_17]OFZ44827.1 MAG: hypothetical protein A2404_09980 [Bdellovibrionales bacterium RIFOXYC1_FULL_39_130]OFZ68386.1 MAG: hypothetical protein A2451_07915 [Bdellovibrionales bacterium RIFOXYC2_FULL_39_8]OFZ74292.1 MAG: hypothetical protein A2560_16945 [Bdellovibrionales bacterium RIFOXYD1_FULL_39_84]OFZ92156.1 MAG:
MKNTLVLFFLLSTFLIYQYASAQSGPRYVKGLSVSLLAEPKNGSTVVNKLERGAAVTQETEQGFWAKIVTPQGTGWVPKLTLSASPPAAQESLMDKKVDISSNARKRASNFTSAGSARGLNESKADFDKANLKADFAALKKMESFYVSPQKALRLLGAM